MLFYCWAGVLNGALGRGLEFCRGSALDIFFTVYDNFSAQLLLKLSRFFVISWVARTLTI